MLSYVIFGWRCTERWKLSLNNRANQMSQRQYFIIFIYSGQPAQSAILTH